MHNLFLNIIIWQMTGTEAKNHSPQSVRIEVIEEAFKRDFPITDATPQWLRMGVDYLAKGQEVTEEDLDKFDRMGGTDHPDPTLRSDPTVSTISSLERH